MKIYTKEQVKSMLTTQEMSLYEKIFTHDEIINMEDGIELPSDEEMGVIALNIASTLKDGLDSREEAFYLAGFQTCAKWMKEQILNQNM